MGFQDVQALPDFVPIPDKMVAQFVEEMNDPQKREKASLVSFDILRSDEKFSLLESLKDDFFAEPPPSPGKLPTRIFSSFVDEHDPWVLPSLQIYASVYAAVMRSNRRISPHDALDLMHAASAVPYCDAFFCDNAMATFVTSKPLELDKVYDTVVLSRSIEIIDYLQSLTR
jgi:hypothetical protein